MQGVLGLWYLGLAPTPEIDRVQEYAKDVSWNETPLGGFYSDIADDDAIDSGEYPTFPTPSAH